MILSKHNFKLYFSIEKSCILHVPIIVASERNEKKSKKERTSGGSDKGRTHAKTALSPRYGYCRLFASVNGSPDSFEQVGRRFTTIGCSGKDGKSAQGDGGLPIQNDDARMYRSELALFSRIPVYTIFTVF